MTEPIRTLAGLNERNREFWERQNILMNERVGYPFILEKAMRTINAESESRLATRSKKSFVRALEDAANQFKASETPLGRIFAIRGGKPLTPLAIKALLLHCADDGGHDKAEVGWGRIPENLHEIVLTDQYAAHIVYQGELRPASWVRMQIPIPADPMNGMVDITATFCFATPTDPQDPLNYTRSGLEVRFRPHDQKRKDPDQVHADSKFFFQAKDVSIEEADLRADAHKWETTLHKNRAMRASGLRNPVFDVHYNARIGGRNAVSADKIPYALVITIESKKTRNLYDKILQR